MMIKVSAVQWATWKTNVKKVVIIHHNDCDGRLGAAVCIKGIQDKLGIHKTDIELHECNYKDKYDFVAMVKDSSTLLIVVDYSIPVEDLEKIKEKVGDKVILLDHHESSYMKYKNQVVKYFGIMEFESNVMKARSGCQLAYEFFYDSKGLNSEVVSLIGEFDTWRHEKTNNMNALYLKYATENYDVYAYEFMIIPDRDFGLQGYLNTGKDIYEYIMSKNSELYDLYAHESKLTGFEKYSCVAMNTGQKSSLTFGENFKKYDICVAYVFDGSQYLYGIYSDGKVNVSEIATSFGGGGHAGASGFTSKKLLV